MPEATQVGCPYCGCPASTEVARGRRGRTTQRCSGCEKYFVRDRGRSFPTSDPSSPDGMPAVRTRD